MKLKFIKNKNMCLIYFCQLITVLKSGKVQIRDTLQGTVLCEPILPKSHELMTPWDPVVAVGAMGQVLFLKGKQKHKINATNVKLTSLLPSIIFNEFIMGNPIGANWKNKDTYSIKMQKCDQSKLQSWNLM